MRHPKSYNLQAVGTAQPLPKPVEPKPPTDEEIRRKFYRRLFAWLELVHPEGFLPWALLQAQGNPYRSTTLGHEQAFLMQMLAIVADWERYQKVVNNRDLEKAVLLAKTYELKYLNDIEDKLKRVKKFMVDNKQR